MHNRALYIFRRDLRIEDNYGLKKALEAAKEVVPVFIFDPAQKGHAYFSTYGFTFLLQSLQDLSAELEKHKSRLFVISGKPIDVIKKLKDELQIEAVFFNRDYSPFARSRDKEIKSFCDDNGLIVKQFADALLNEPETCVKDDKKPYTVFTPFFKKNSLKEIPRPFSLKNPNFYKGSLSIENAGFIETELRNCKDIPEIKGGRKKALKILENIKKFQNYQSERDFPELSATTHLSPHNKFGTCSVREFYYAAFDALGTTHPLIRQFYWRDFFTHIAFHFPHVFGKSFNSAYDKVEWIENSDYFKAWCEGKTGFPIVDAGMRELNNTGYMHNRLRMIVASFLTKDLHIDWRKGEKYFATKLVDYDPCVNNGSWQWAASTGCDAQPYFRIFNPWLQQEKFDKECVYIKKWVPELRDLSPKEIHNIKDLEKRPNSYPAPIVDHSFEKKLTLEMFDVLKD